LALPFMAPIVASIGPAKTAVAAISMKCRRI
jgi:hypothetical protein